MLNPDGYPSSLTHISPDGPCTLTITWADPHDRIKAADAPTATAYLTASPLTIDGAAYYANAWTNLHDDLTFTELHPHLELAHGAPPAPDIPAEHHAYWHQHATTVLRELLTPETYLALHRTDTRHRLHEAQLDVASWTRNLEQATDELRRAETLDAVLHLDNPDHRAIGLRLAPTWHGTSEELLTVVAALADTDT